MGSSPHPRGVERGEGLYKDWGGVPKKNEHGLKLTPRGLVEGRTGGVQVPARSEKPIVRTSSASEGKRSTEGKGKEKL